MNRPENLFQPPEYSPEMFAEYFENEKKRALRISEIEAILGDDYDLDRLRELVEADRDGRCVVLPVKPGGTVRFARNPRAKHETVDAITIYPDGRMSFGFHEYGMKTEWVDRWCEDDANNYVPVESSESALKGEHDEQVH